MARMTLPPLPPKKEPEVRTCKSCRLQTMSQGDWAGWKGIDMGNARMDWYCDKPICIEQRDQVIAGRQLEMMHQMQESNRLANERDALARAADPLRGAEIKVPWADEEDVTNKVTTPPPVVRQSTAPEETRIPPNPVPEDAEPVIERPIIDYTLCQVFEPAFIEQVKAGSMDAVKGTVLIPPSAYPEMDMKLINPDHLRKGIAAMFPEAGLYVSDIWHAYSPDTGEFVGIAFDLAPNES